MPYEKKADRAARYARERKEAGDRKLAWITERFAEGRSVIVTTYLRSTKFTPAFDRKYGAFKVDSTGSLYMRRGSAWDCIDGNRITAV